MDKLDPLSPVLFLKHLTDSHWQSLRRREKRSFGGQVSGLPVNYPSKDSRQLEVLL